MRLVKQSLSITVLNGHLTSSAYFFSCQCLMHLMFMKFPSISWKKCGEAQENSDGPWSNRFGRVDLHGDCGGSSLWKDRLKTDGSGVKVHLGGGPRISGRPHTFFGYCMILWWRNQTAFPLVFHFSKYEFIALCTFRFCHRWGSLWQFALWSLCRMPAVDLQYHNTEYGGSGPLRFAKPQSCKASLALHASKLQSLKAAKLLWRLTPQSLKAPKPLWRLTPQSLKAAKPLWRLTLQSLKASKPERLDALALGGSFRLWRFLALFRRLKASKPERLDAVALWRFGAWRLLHALALLDAFPMPQSLNASKPERLDALALRRVSYASKPQSLNAWMLWRFGALALGALALWRFGAWRSWCFGASWPFGALRLFDALALWRFGAWRSWCFGASWPFGALRLFDALALLGALRLRGSVTLWHFAALWDMPSWKKSDFLA